MYEGTTMRRVMIHTRTSDPQFDCFEITPIRNPFSRIQPFTVIFRRSATGSEDPPQKHRKNKFKDFFTQRRMK